MRFAVALAAAGLSLFALAAAVMLPVGRETLAQPATTTVQVGDYYFCDPSYVNGVCETTVDEGDTVEWQFAGNELHSTTECGDDNDTCSAPHLWDSPLMDSGSFSYTFDTPGTYLYRCQAHTFEMRGQVTVLAAAQPTPTPQASPQASPLAATSTPAAQPGAVPSGGGAPPADAGATLSWLAVVAGGMMVAAAVAIVARGLRRRDA
jgi:hypothetical protein